MANHQPTFLTTCSGVEESSRNEAVLIIRATAAGGAGYGGGVGNAWCTHVAPPIVYGHPRVRCRIRGTIAVKKSNHGFATTVAAFGLVSYGGMVE